MIHRIIDANINRACEGVRVLEDYFRFELNNQGLSRQLRDIRHRLRRTYCSDELVRCRDSQGDVGRATSMETGDDRRTGRKDMLMANFKRAEEAIRVIEENLKLIEQYDLSKQYEKLRFLMYNLEKSALRQIEYIGWEIYAITCERLCGGRDNIEVARELLENGIRVLQYREKEKSKREKLEQCMQLRALTREYGCTFIVNDDLDIALLCEADGVHLGQEDLPVQKARKLSGDMIIGVSTHNEKQAQKALQQGADYIGVGPMFETDTKRNLEPCNSVDYLRYTCENIPLPQVAIGGISPENLRLLLEATSDAGVPLCFAMIGGLLLADDLGERIRQIKSIIKEYHDVPYTDAGS